ncbi:MAG: GGDEF domain-containing protein [Acidobacteria bacterium]|jgi:diguanylate cyclase (GGDEF)-like protein|nr:GGDEF domain-containing protein [Acidobacteriota bacterium]
MGDLYEETICDRKPLPPANGALQAEQAIVLTVIAGSETDFGKHFVLERKRTTIGREKANDVALSDGKVSKAHCEIAVIRSSRGVEQIGILDLDSTNGTYVNGEAVVQATLKAGDKIQVGATILQLSYSDEIEREYHAKLFDFAARDALTGLYNKRFIVNELENYCRIARRSERAFSVIMIDLDDFKRINDRYGHLAGDEYLAAVAGLFSRSLREQDIAGRIGGEEFLVILPETVIEGALHLAVRMRMSVEAFVLTYQGSDIRTTMSAGVCQYEKGIKDVKELLDLADQALYEAKKAEKNRVMRVALADLAEK